MFILLEGPGLATEGVAHQVIGIPSQGMKLFLYDTALKELVGRQIPPNEAVLLLDAWDTIVLGPAEARAFKLNFGRLAGCEGRNCVVAIGIDLVLIASSSEFL